MRDLLARAVRTLASAGDPSASLDARLLLAHVLECEPAWLLAHDDAALDARVATTFERAIARRSRGEPVAYILGRAGFYGRQFLVTPDVLVPRPETEELVERALDVLRAHSQPRVIDIGTGSGAIALTIAAERADAQVTALDISGAALEVAKRNAAALHLEARVRFIRDTNFAAALGERFDAILANLPYVRSSDLAAAPDPTSFEPRLALDGGADGLGLYRALLAALPHIAQPGAFALFEAGPDSAGALAALGREGFPEARVRVIDDLSARERLVEMRL